MKQLCFAWLAAAVLSSISADAAETKSIYNTQDEEIPFLDAEEALRRFKLPPGFQATLFAAEPAVQQPIGMTFDSRGRLWVAENYTYSEMPRNFDTELRDRIVILEDRDGDGRHDSRKVFWDQALKLTSVAVGMGGVFAMCPPHLLFIPDANRDDVPDGPPQILLDGWEHGSIRHTLANGLKFGPDGWLYGRQGIQGTSMVGQPGSGPAARTAVNACIWRYHLTSKKFELVAQGTTNPWGADWDEHGELFFINTVIGHLWHTIPGSYFKRMYGQPFNPHVYEEIDQVADHVHWDTRERWDDIRSGITSTTSQAGGGHAHTGLLLYQADNWPAEFRNSMLTLNFHGKRINRDTIERHGATYTAKHRPDAAAIDDPYFRGIDLMTGPDGGVYIADWSDIGECHDHNGIHRTSGRVYRITHGAPAKGLDRDLAELSNLELVKLQAHRNEWHVRQAREILQARAIAGAKLDDARAALMDLLHDGQVRQKLRALWALHCIGAASEALLLEQLKSPNEHLRVWGVRLLSDEHPSSPAVLQAFAQLAAQDRSGLVLCHLAGALQRIAPAERWPIALALAQRGEFATDRVLPLMTWHGIEASVPGDAKRAVQLAEMSKLPKVRALAVRRVLEDAAKDPGAAGGMLALLLQDSLASERETILRAALLGVEQARMPAAPPMWQRVASELAKSSDADVRRLAVELDAVFGSRPALLALRQQAAEAAAPAAQRKRALEVLLRTRDAELRPFLKTLLADNEVGADAVEGLATLGGPGTAETLLGQWGALAPAARSEAVNALATKPAWALALLDAVQRGAVDRKQIGAGDLRQLRGIDDADVREKIARIWPASDSSAQLAVAKYKEVLKPGNMKQADLQRGREVFQLACASCHKLYGEGGTIGPELTGSDRQNLDYLLDNILSPSSVVPEAYRVSNISLKDERVLSGIVLSRTEQNVALQTLTDNVSVPRAEIDSIQESELSMMPDGLLETLAEQQIIDLIGYLQSSSPAPAPPVKR